MGAFVNPSYFSEDEIERRAKAMAHELSDKRIEQMALIEDEQWHLDKKVPITIIAAIVIQTVGFIYIGSTWKADVDNRLSNLEKSDADRKPQEARIIILEQGIGYIRSDLQEIKGLLKAPSRVLP